MMIKIVVWIVTGQDGADGSKAFYIYIEAKIGMEEVIRMLEDIYDFVLEESATRLRFGLRCSPTTFGIFKAFPDIGARDTHVAGEA